VYPDRQDGSIPVCSGFRIWKTGLSDLQNLLIYNSYKPYSCVGTWQSKILDILNTRFGSVSFSSASEAAEVIRALKTRWSNLNPTDTKVINMQYDVNNWRYFLSETYLGVPESIPWLVVQVFTPILFYIVKNTTNKKTPQTPRPQYSMLQLVRDTMRKSWSIEQDSQQVALRFNYSVPPLTSDSGIVLDTNYKPQDPVAVANTGTSDLSNYQTRCAYTPKQVYPSVNVAQDCTGTDTDWICYKKRCENLIPIFSHVGAFFCHYHYLNQLPNANFNVTDEVSVFLFLYNYMRTQFNQQRTEYMNSFLQTETLAFFTDTESQTGWQFSFADELNYTNNNQPDTTKTVMCSITNTDKVIQYNQCNHPHWFKIRDHVQKFYYRQGGIIVPPSMQMQWRVSNKLLLAGFLSKFASKNKVGQETFLQNLFTAESACIGETNDWKEKVFLFFVSLFKPSFNHFSNKGLLQIQRPTRTSRRH